VSLWRWLRAAWIPPQQLVGEDMLDAAQLDWTYHAEAGGRCEYCRRNMAMAWMREIRISPKGESFLHIRRGAVGEACTYCHYATVDRYSSKQRRLTLAEFCEAYKFEGAV
jgi:hypothetical protein